MEKEFFDGTYGLSLLDKNRKKPEIYIWETNRSGGKSTYFDRLFVNSFKKKKRKFALIYRNKYEIEDCGKNFFNGVKSLFFKNDECTTEIMMKGVYANIYLNGEHCGFGLPLSSASKIKLLSHLFYDVEHMLFDEFQSEDDKYLKDEITKFISIHTSVARGGGEFIRRVPVYMLSNGYSAINPYYTNLGVTSQLQPGVTKQTMKGNGWVCIRDLVKGAEESMNNSAFLQAFSNSPHVKHVQHNTYIIPKSNLVSKKPANSVYNCSLKYGHKRFSIWRWTNGLYVSNSYDVTNKNKIAVTVKDIDDSFVYFNRSHPLITAYRQLYMASSVYFEDHELKDMFCVLVSL